MNKGRITSSTRRFVTLIDSSGTSFIGKRSTRDMELSPGDLVDFKKPDIQDGNLEVDILDVTERSNCLKRSYFGKTKVLASNLSCLWIVISPPPLFNCLSLDRTLTAATIENIPVVLIANKNDLLKYSEINQQLEYYKRLCSNVFFVSAKTGENIEELKKLLIGEDIVTAVTGVSGVGKSSLLKKILNLKDEELIRVDDVSEKTGQGRQTTSAGMGYLLENNNSNFDMIIDLPGIQSYGISHLTEAQVKRGMTDIKEISGGCKFSNCTHDKEPNCAIKESINSGNLLASRLYSLNDMLEEIKKANTY